MSFSTKNGHSNLNKKPWKLWPEDIKENYRYSAARSSARKRNLAFELSRDEFISLAYQPCYYCKQQKEETGYGLDRIDNSKGYTLDNVLPCCGSCNCHRFKDWSVDEMVVAINAVTQYRNTILPKQNYRRLYG